MFLHFVNNHFPDYSYCSASQICWTLTSLLDVSECWMGHPFFWNVTEKMQKKIRLWLVKLKLLFTGNRSRHRAFPINLMIQFCISFNVYGRGGKENAIITSSWTLFENRITSRKALLGGWCNMPLFQIFFNNDIVRLYYYVYIVLLFFDILYWYCCGDR